MSPTFQPLQIVCLEHSTGCVYAEIIQIVEERRLCWARPLALVRRDVALNMAGSSLDPACYFAQFSTQPFNNQLDSQLYDLRQGADLLCPLSLFRAALDIEVIPVLMALDASKAVTETMLPTSALEVPQPGGAAHRQLQVFIQQLWQDFPEAFQPE